MSSTFEEIDFREGFAGGCLRNGQAICVHRNEDYCDLGTWVTAHYVRSNPGHPLRYCAGELENVVIGRCGATGACSNVAERCQVPSSFVPYDPTCTITLDLNTSEPTKYGKCGDRCVWNEHDCPEGGYVNWSPDCTAEQVGIGSCFAGHAFCAVSAESCEQEGQTYNPYLTHEETLEQIGVNCMLSYLPEAPSAPVSSPREVVPPATAPTRPPGSSPTFPPETLSAQAIAPASTSSEKLHNKGLSSGALAGIVTASAVFAGVLIGYVSYRIGVRSVRRNGEDKSTKPPMASVEASSRVDVEEDEEISVF